MLNKIKNGTDSLKELLVIYIVATTVVAILFALFEGKNLFDAYWWTFVTGLTIGYGDIYPFTVAGKVLTVVWANFMVFALAPLAVARIVVGMVNNKNEFTDKEQKEMLRLLRKANKGDTK